VKASLKLAILLLGLAALCALVIALLNGCSFRMFPGPAGLPHIDLRITGLEPSRQAEPRPQAPQPGQ
jgi:hypothetical protein